MKSVRKFIWVFLFLLIVIVTGSLGYISIDNKWQDNYRKRTSEEIVKLLQTNPYDQLAVVVVVIDGLRWQEGIGSEDKYIPHIWNDLRPLGTLLTNFWIDSPTATTSVHTAMLSGRISTVPNDGHIRPVFPTFLEAYRDARKNYVESELQRIVASPKGLFRPNKQSLLEVSKLIEQAKDFPPEKTALYLGKDLIHNLDQSSSGRSPDDDVHLIDCRRDIEIFEYFRAKIPDVKPNLVFVNLGDVDECGHEVEWFYYVDAIRWADRWVYKMWQTLQEHARYRDKTLFIVTTDHGRHSPERGGYAHHCCFCDGCRRSFMLLIGPGIRKGYISNERYSEMDLAPTIAKACGFSMPWSTGKPILEAFEESWKFPPCRETNMSKLAASDSIKADQSDPAKLLLDSTITNATKDSWGPNPNTAMLLLAIAARIETHPDEATSWITKVPPLPDSSLKMEKLEDLFLVYPMLRLGKTNEESTSSVCLGFRERGEDLFGRAQESGALQIWNTEKSHQLYENVQVAAATAPAFALMGKLKQDDKLTGNAFSLLLNVLALYEPKGKVTEKGLENFIDDFRYREGPNEIFTEKKISMRDRMWLLWGIERTLAESDPTHTPELRNLLERQYRLLVAFCHEWQDANSMIGGTGNLNDEIDYLSQGLFLGLMSDFQPWRRWELDELGYSDKIYATPLFSFPYKHFFYLLGQANALAGAWTANERLKLMINEDGSIRRDVLDSLPAIKPADDGYALIAASLAYGFARFEKADWNLFDLELYPLVHQKETAGK